MKAFLEELNRRRLRSYTEDPGLLKEHYGIEQSVLAGGYGYRQILELVQNGADAILEAHEHSIPPVDGNRIHVLLRESRLYVANTGAPLSEEGLDALLRSHSSPKRGNQIGRFGLGFKSLLKLEGRIDLFTRACGAIRFDPQRCRDELRRQFNVADAPCLRLAWPLDEVERAADSTCASLAWAETIVRVDIGAKETHEHLRQEIRAFPAEFLLFFPVTTVLTLDDGEQVERELRLEHDGNERILHDGTEKSRWRVSERELRITDARALADATHIHARESVPLAWAVPLEGRREEAGRFWAFFPTHTPSYVPGILNAPWKLNSDRNAIIGGEWNTALMVEAASLIADTLPKLSFPTDPGRPLDALPTTLVLLQRSRPGRYSRQCGVALKGLMHSIGPSRSASDHGGANLQNEKTGLGQYRGPLARNRSFTVTRSSTSSTKNVATSGRPRKVRLTSLMAISVSSWASTKPRSLRDCHGSLKSSLPGSSATNTASARGSLVTMR